MNDAECSRSKTARLRHLSSHNARPNLLHLLIADVLALFEEPRCPIFADRLFRYLFWWRKRFEGLHCDAFDILLSARFPLSEAFNGAGFDLLYPPTTLSKDDSRISLSLCPSANAFRTDSDIDNMANRVSEFFCRSTEAFWKSGKMQAAGS